MLADVVHVGDPLGVLCLVYHVFAVDAIQMSIRIDDLNLGLYLLDAAAQSTTGSVPICVVQEVWGPVVVSAYVSLVQHDV